MRYDLCQDSRAGCRSWGKRKTGGKEWTNEKRKGEIIIFEPVGGIPGAVTLFYFFYFFYFCNCCFLLVRRDEARRKLRGEAFNVISIVSGFLTAVHSTRRSYSLSASECISHTFWNKTYLHCVKSTTTESSGNRFIDCPRDGSHLAREGKEKKKEVMTGDAKW